MNIHRIAYAIALLGLSIPTASAADVARVETRVAADSVTVGERLRVEFKAVYPDSLTLLPPAEFDTGNCRLLTVVWRDDVSEHTRIKSADLEVMTVDLENAHLPALPFLFLTPGGDTLEVFSDEVNVPVRALTTAQSEPQPLKPQWRAPRDFLYYYIAGAAVLVLAALAYYFWHRRRRRRGEVAPPPPQLPGDYVALRELVRIEQMDLVASGKLKRHYTLVVDVVRHYLESRYAVQTMDRTTNEILADLDAIHASVEGLDGLMREADLVKFAKFHPDEAQGRRIIESARDIIVRTTPHAIPEEPEEARARV